MADLDGADERALIRGVDAHLLERYEVVVDDVVLRAWGNEQVELTHLMLTAAIAGSGATPDVVDLWRVARAVAFGQALLAPRARLAG